MIYSSSYDVKTTVGMATEAQTGAFCVLPQEIHEEIVTYLPAKDISNLKNTCRQIYHLITNDKKFVQQVMKHNGEALICANLTLKRLPKLQQLAFAYFKDLQSNKVLDPLPWDLLRSLSYSKDNLVELFQIPFFRQCKEIVLAAVAIDAHAFKYASIGLQNNRKVVMVAGLAYASEELRNDKNFVLAMVARKGSQIFFANKELQKDKEVMVAAVAQEQGLLAATSYSSRELRITIGSYGSTCS